MRNARHAHASNDEDVQPSVVGAVRVGPGEQFAEPLQSEPESRLQEVHVQGMQETSGDIYDLEGHGPSAIRGTARGVHLRARLPKEP